MNKDNKQLYFAYGSNLNSQDLASFAKDSRFKKEIYLKKYSSDYVLPDYKLVFTKYSKKREGGVLDILPAKGSCVFGVVFEIDEGEKLIIDAKEGKGTDYETKEVTLVNYRGEELNCFTYVVKEEVKDTSGFVMPNEKYFKLVLKGLSEHNLSNTNLIEASKNQYKNLDSIFVYGTLMQGEEREHIMQKYSPLSIRAAQVNGNLYNMGSYPALKNLYSNRDNNLVQGEVWKFSGEIVKALLVELDEIEEFFGYNNKDNLYIRVPTKVDLYKQENCFAWTYVYVQSITEGQEIKTNDWRKRI